MPSGVEFDDEAFRASLRTVMKELEIRTERQLVALALNVVNSAKRICPVDTGRLRSSITSSGLQHDSGGAYVEVGTNVNYAGYVEFGTMRSPAQPYLRPALLEATKGWGKR